LSLLSLPEDFVQLLAPYIKPDARLARNSEAMDTFTF